MVHTGVKMERISDPLTHAIIGCAMTVHNALGNGFHGELGGGSGGNQVGGRFTFGQADLKERTTAPREAGKNIP